MIFIHFNSAFYFISLQKHKRERTISQLQEPINYKKLKPTIDGLELLKNQSQIWEKKNVSNKLIFFSTVPGERGGTVGEATVML